LKNQVVYVPKGTTYTIYDKRTQTQNFTGYLVLPVGNANYLGLKYPITDVDYEQVSTGPFYFYDENGNMAVPKSSDDLKDYLISRSSSAKPYWWNVNTNVIINKYTGGSFYTPCPINSNYTVNYSVGRYSTNIIGPSGGENPTYVVNDNNNLASGRNYSDKHEN